VVCECFSSTHLDLTKSVGLLISRYGRQVLTKEGQWIKATPIEGTIVVNIGDFMMRLCNDFYKYVNLSHNNRT